MADISITASNVTPGSGQKLNRGVAGAAISAGDLLYKDLTDANKMKLADANLSDAAAVVAGMAVQSAAVGQPVLYQDVGEINLGAVLTAGSAYILSATAGKLAPIADKTTGWRTSFVGVAKTTSILRLRIFNSGVTN